MEKLEKNLEKLERKIKETWKNTRKILKKIQETMERKLNLENFGKKHGYLKKL